MSEKRCVIVTMDRSAFWLGILNGGRFIKPAGIPPDARLEEMWDDKWHDVMCFRFYHPSFEPVAELCRYPEVEMGALSAPSEHTDDAAHYLMGMVDPEEIVTR